MKKNFSAMICSAIAIALMYGFSASLAKASVMIDTPSPNATVSGLIVVHGWAIDNSNAIDHVEIDLDNVQVGIAQYGSFRPDVCVDYPNVVGCPVGNVGYSFNLNTAALTPGPHTVSAMAVTSAGSAGNMSVSFTVVATPPTVYIDTPTSLATVSGKVTVSGWAIDNMYSAASSTKITSVQVKVDGILDGFATYGSARPDVCVAFPGRAGCPNVGFSYILNSSKLKPGAHTITVLATDGDATPHTGSATVTINTPH